MPASKKRKKGSPKGNPATRAIPRPSPLRRRETEDELAARVRAQFIAITLADGHLFPSEATYTPVGPPVECWTNAWRHADTHRLGYAEGVALMPNGWHAHAWCVAEDGTVIEPTLGYDHATEYRGWILNLEGRHAITVMLDEEPRSSFLESGLGSGVATWEQIRDRFVAVPRREHPAG